jgi:hypothetical protein
MTGPTVEPQSRELVVSRDLLLALGDAARGKAPAGSADELTGRGLIGPDGRPVEAVAATAGAVGSPLATLHVAAARPDGTAAADLWVGTTRAVLHPAGDGAAAVVSVSRSLLPQLLVRATGLGPRPLSEGPRFSASAALVAAACTGTATPPWPGEEAVERPRLWRVTWRAADGAHGDVSVLDLGRLGLWRPGAGQGEELTWSPVSGAAVWQQLSRLFAVTLEDRPAS